MFFVFFIKHVTSVGVPRVTPLDVMSVKLVILPLVQAHVMVSMDAVLP